MQVWLRDRSAHAEDANMNIGYLVPITTMSQYATMGVPQTHLTAMIAHRKSKPDVEMDCYGIP